MDQGGPLEWRLSLFLQHQADPQRKKNTTHTVTVSVNTGVCGQGLCVLLGVATDVSAIIVVNFHAIYMEPTLDQQNDQDVSLKFIRLLQVVFSSQQRLNQPAVNAVQ